MKLVSILGSPRKKGVTSQIARAFSTKAEEQGAQIIEYHLNTLDFKGCQGCNACKSKLDHCALKDGLTPVLEDLKTADITLFATPVYYWDVTGQFKCFMDRTWSLVKPDYQTNPDPVRLDRGKKAVLITSQGDVADKHRDVTQKYTGFLQMYGYDTHTIRACEMGMDTDERIGPFLDLAREKARELIVQ